MGLINWIMHKQMKKDAKRIANHIAKLYPEAKRLLPNAPESQIIRSMAFNEDKFSKSPEQVRNMIETCCKTVNGFGYLMALNTGVVKKAIVFRALQFTAYMDRELESLGFARQSIQQKEEILDVLDLKHDGWQKWTGEE